MAGKNVEGQLELFSLFDSVEELKAQKESLFANYAAHNKVVRQLIDLALLQNGMLKGEALSQFIKRSDQRRRTERSAGRTGDGTVLQAP